MHIGIGLIIVLAGICYKLAEMDARLSPPLCAALSVGCSGVGLYVMGGSWLAVLGLHLGVFVIGCLIMLWKSDGPTSG